MNGRPLVLNWADANIPAIVEAWQLGTQSGNAIAQVLYGDYNPSGKLPMSFLVLWGKCRCITTIRVPDARVPMEKMLEVSFGRTISMKK